MTKQNPGSDDGPRSGNEPEARQEREHTLFPPGTANTAAQVVRLITKVIDILSK